MADMVPLDLPNVNGALLEDSDEVSLVMHAETPPTVSTSRNGGELDSERSILNQNIDDVEAILKEMIRLTVAIRKTGAPSRLQKADNQFDLDAHQDLKVHLQFFLMVHVFEKRDYPFQPESLQLSGIQWRLIEANLRRRNRFLYQQIHSKKLAVKVIQPPQNIKREEKSLWEILKRKIRSLFTSCFTRKKRTSLRQTTQPHFMEASQPAPSTENLTTTSASRIQGHIRTVKQSPTTVVSSTATRADYPNPPKLESGQHVFKCPCCCQSLGKEFTQRNKWRKHLAEDIQPYTCILDDCPKPWNFFENRESWERHMQAEHKGLKYWRCPDTLCEDKRDFELEDDFVSHLQTIHDGSVQPNDIPFLISACVRSSPAKIRSCPLCPQTNVSMDMDIESLFNHVAYHVNYFSLKSLPWAPNEEDVTEVETPAGRANDYFHKNPYFDIGGKNGSSAQDRDHSVSSRSLDSVSKWNQDDPAQARESFADQAIENEPEDDSDATGSTGSETGVDTVSDIDPHNVEHRKKAASRLRKLLFDALEMLPDSSSFYIPEDRKTEIITHSVIRGQAQFGIADRSALSVKNIHDRSRNLFTALAYMKRAHEIRTFIDEGLSDADLPFIYQTPTRTLTRRNGGEIRSVKNWSKADKLTFAGTQWYILVPVFSAYEHYELHDRTILPFTHERVIGAGAYNEVHEADIHPAHHKWCQGPVPSSLAVVINKLHYHDEDDFEKERSILLALEAKGNNHLVKLLFSYEHKGSYHLVFLRAAGNLRTFWEHNPQPQFVPNMVLWSLRQMAGITQGLRIIHNFQVTIPLSVTEMEMKTPLGKALMSVSSGEERYGRHGDLKPENILWFRDSTGDVCQITDFGLGRFHGRDTRTKAAPYTILSSPAYEPPECHLYLPVSRAYDMWSLGCMFLEWVSWMLNGWQAIGDFSRSRLEQSLIMNQEGVISDDYFWSLVIDGNDRNARVRDGVEKWVLKLREHPKCSKLIHDILSIIMQDLLCIVPSHRSTAATLHHNLVNLISRAESDDQYMLDPSPWVPKISITHQRNRIFFIPTADAGRSVVSSLECSSWPPSQLRNKQTGKLDRNKDMIHRAGSPPFRPSRHRSRRANELWQKVLDNTDSGAFRDAVFNSSSPINEERNLIESTENSIGPRKISSRASQLWQKAFQAIESGALRSER